MFGNPSVKIDTDLLQHTLFSCEDPRADPDRNSGEGNLWEVNYNLKLNILWEVKVTNF